MAFRGLKTIAQLDNLDISAEDIAVLVAELQGGFNPAVLDKIRQLGRDLDADPIGTMTQRGWDIVRLGGAGIGMFAPEDLIDTSAFSSV